MINLSRLFSIHKVDLRCLMHAQYVDIHTESFPNGEIKGQLLAKIETPMKGERDEIEEREQQDINDMPFLANE
jgi:hypothetical protein